jgi:hypothetical protein
LPTKKRKRNRTRDEDVCEYNQQVSQQINGKNEFSEFGWNGHFCDPKRHIRHPKQKTRRYLTAQVKTSIKAQISWKFGAKPRDWKFSVCTFDMLHVRIDT